MKNLPKDGCTGCSACASVCPKNCIQLLPDEEGFCRPTVDEAACISCGLCEKICPVLAGESAPQTRTQAYAAACRDDGVRRESTSGGVFTLLAQWIFDRGGTVFGAAYGEDFSVCHCQAHSMEELGKLRTAKYAQSAISGIFPQVKALLEAGEYVLFSGTPCQTEGLRAYLRHPYEHLVVADVVCHGVPSPKVWQAYLRFRRETDAPQATVQSINLRSKETGWPGYSIRFAYDDGTVYSRKNNVDSFLRGFVGDLYLRPSCYECPFKGISRHSDFTLADYWGVWSQHPELNDGKGLSMVLVHSEKAREIWTALQDRMQCLELDPEMAVSENPSAVRASARPEGREAFWARYERENFDALIAELLPPPPPPAKPSLLRRGLRKAKHMLMKK